MIRRPPRSTPFPTRRSSDLAVRRGAFPASVADQCSVVAEEQVRSPLAWFVPLRGGDRKSTRLNSSHLVISYAVFCLKKKNNRRVRHWDEDRRTDTPWRIPST